MKALHLLGALLLVLCGWCAGELHRRKAAARSADLRQTQALLHRIRQEISYRRMDLNRLYRQLCAEGMKPDGGAFQRMAPPESFSAGEKVCFCECMQGLGRAEAQQECERLDYYIQRFEDFRREAEQREREAAALDRKIGLAAGAMLALLFL